MPAATNVENNFTQGLKTEFTGLNFPENAAIAANNTEFTLVGDVTRRLGIDYLDHDNPQALVRGNNAIASYKWNNVGGDGETQFVVKQVGAVLYFYISTQTTFANPLSTQILGSTVTVSSFVASGGTFDPTVECQFSDGNGYLFVYHPTCDPIYVTYSGGTVTGNRITVQIRDFVGVPEPGVSDTTRPSSLSNEHFYNLLNQGWSSTGTWLATSTTVLAYSSLTDPANLNNSFTVGAGLPIVPGTPVLLQATIFDSGGGNQFISNATGAVVSYSGTSLVINTNPIGFIPTIGTSPTSESWAITPINPGGQIQTWLGSIGNYPSNSDQWWTFKDTQNRFNPLATFANIVNTSPAPKGHFVLSAFVQNRNAASGIGVTEILTTVRPRTGTWFQGRVWYAGVDATQAATGDAPLYTWTENIYFSQVVQTPTDFGQCYQLNDPSSENLFDLLPTDGGIIQIQGSGAIYKLFPIQNGMLVFAANGVWFITGSQGIGFTANDYTVTKISNVRSISSYSFVNVQGLPYFWNQEGIYAVEPTQGGQLTVNPLTVGTILTFYNQIPYDSIKYARGDYDPIGYIIQWVYRSTEESSVNSRYTFDSILNFNTYNKAFFPYTVDTSVNSINGIVYVSSPGGEAPAPATLMYVSSTAGSMSYSTEYDDSYADWGDINYDSTFTTGFKLHGQALKRFQLEYLYVYSRSGPTSYKIQGVWDYATTGNSGRWSVLQLINNWNPNFGMTFRRHKIRGRGLVLQLQFTSVDGQPFDIMGWAAFETINASV